MMEQQSTALVHAPNGGTGELIKPMAAADAMSISTLEQALLQGNLASMNPQQRLEYYRGLCKSLGLNPLTKPFEYLELDGKLTLYAKKDATEQLRSTRGISLKIVGREIHEGVYVVTAQATDPTGRTDESTGAVPIVKEGGQWKTSQNGKRFFEGDGKFHPLAPEARANALMKAETKAKRRVTLSICGLGMLDESELDTVHNARPVPMDVPAEGSQEAAENVAAAKLAAASPTAKVEDVPAPVLHMWQQISKGGASYVSQLLHAYRQELDDLLGDDDFFRSILAKHGIPGADQEDLKGIKGAALKGIILDLYRAVDGARQAETEAQREADDAQVPGGLQGAR
jgi:hypothetical protein